MTKLTEEMVVARSRQSDLASIKKLNCWGSDLSDVSIIRRMRGVEVLALSVNKISSLQDFENCRNLQELYLRKNNIQDINELAYLQSLPNLKYLWLEENPCCDGLGSNYRALVLRALPNLKKLDNIDVTPEEVQDALRMISQPQRDEEVYEDNDDRTNTQQSSQQQQQKQQHQQPHQQHQQQYQSQHRRSQSPIRDTLQNIRNDLLEENICDQMNQQSIPTSPLQRISPNQEFSTFEQVHPPSPKYNRDHRMSYHQYDKNLKIINNKQRSPGSDQESPSGGGGYRERGPIPPSISSHSMKEYYQSDYQKPSHPMHYRHSQSDLTEWDEHHSQCNGGSHHQQRKSGGIEREIIDKYGYRNGNIREKDDWEDGERIRRDRRTEGRLSDTASVVSNAVLNHYAGYHRRPVNRSSNLLSATLCLVKELDYPSLEVVEHAVRCRIDELSAE